MQRFGIWAASVFFVIGTGFGITMVAKLVTGSGDWRYNSIMMMLHFACTLASLNLSRRP